MATIPHFVRRLNLVIAAAGLVLTACPDPNANDGGNETGKECHLGEFGCPCNEGQCLGDLKCLGDICGQGCVDGAGSKCMDGDVYWVDSCGNQTNIYDECTAPQICVDAPNGTAHCQGIGDCGNGIIEKDRGEECEGTDLDGADCKDLGFGGGMLSCSEHCTFDLIACDRCGNGQLDAPNEQCDGNAGLMTCQELGYDEGTLSCTPDCKYDTTGCSSSECDCSTGTCCDGCKFEPPGVVCQADAQIEYGCPWGTEVARALASTAELGNAPEPALSVMETTGLGLTGASRIRAAQMRFASRAKRAASHALTATPSSSTNARFSLQPTAGVPGADRSSGSARLRTRIPAT